MVFYSESDLAVPFSCTGVEGGFEVDEKKYEYEENNAVMLLPDWTSFPLPNKDLPPEVGFLQHIILSLVLIFHFA